MNFSAPEASSRRVVGIGLQSPPHDLDGLQQPSHGGFDRPRKFLKRHVSLSGLSMALSAVSPAQKNYGLETKIEANGDDSKQGHEIDDHADGNHDMKNNNRDKKRSQLSIDLDGGALGEAEKVDETEEMLLIADEKVASVSSSNSGSPSSMPKWGGEHMFMTSKNGKNGSKRRDSGSGTYGWFEDFQQQKSFASLGQVSKQLPMPETTSSMFN